MTRPTARPARVVFANRHLIVLDRLGASVRERYGASLQRAEIVRALVDGPAESKLDLGRVDLTDPQTREANLRALFAARLGAKHGLKQASKC